MLLVRLIFGLKLNHRPCLQKLVADHAYLAMCVFPPQASVWKSVTGSYYRWLSPTLRTILFSLMTCTSLWCLWAARNQESHSDCWRAWESWQSELLFNYSTLQSREATHWEWEWELWSVSAGCVTAFRILTCSVLVPIYPDSVMVCRGSSI